MVYLILDLESGNAVDSFTSEGAALDEVRMTVAEIGREAAQPWALLSIDESGERHGIAHGERLIELAFSEALKLSEGVPLRKFPGESA